MSDYSREYIFSVLCKHVRDVLPDLADRDLKPQNSLRELGANSIDRADITMEVMDTLSLQIPRADLLGPRNLGNWRICCTPSCSRSEVVITGVGVCSAIGQGKAAFGSALFEGRHAFSHLRRPGRQPAGEGGERTFLGAEIGELATPERLTPRVRRTASWSAQVAVATLHEAWIEAGLDALDPERIGLVVGGSNVQQRELHLVHNEYADRLGYLRPSYATSFLDTDLCGLCSELFGIRGVSYSVGAASASGQAAVIQAAQAVASGQVDACIALGALMDLSVWECQALRSAGAMGSDRYADAPALACRPFDRDRDGFIFGEACAALVVERAGQAQTRGVSPYAHLAGWAFVIDANRSTNPSGEGELRAIRGALQRAGFTAADIDYVNPHGTGSPLGDTIELGALRAAGLHDARINATKAFTGHGLSAAGAVEVAATLIQMRSGRLHPTRNLDNPIDSTLAWTGAAAETHHMRRALTLSMGFGGINTALCFSHPEIGT